MQFGIKINNNNQDIKAREKMHSKSKQVHVGYDGTVYELNSYAETLKNHQTCSFLIQSLTPDLDFNTEWMSELQSVYKLDKKQQRMPLIGSVHIVVGSARCGKLGYTYYRKQQQSRQFKENIKIIVIDCIYYSTPYSFVCELVEQLAICMDKNLSTNKTRKKQKDGTVIEDAQALSKLMIVESGSINLKQLDKHILSRPNLKIVLAIKNCELLVEKKKQVILYNLLDWIKTDIKEQIGYALITRRLDFIDKLEKRVKSRMNAKMVFLLGPRDERVIKEAIIKRFKYSLKGIEDETLSLQSTKIIHFIQKSSVVDTLLRKQQTIHSPKQMQFFLEIFRLILALQFTNKQRTIMPKDQKQFDLLFQRGYEKSKLHLAPYTQRQKYVFQNMNFPEFITMSIIRKMLIEEKSRISLKQIKKQLALFKQNNYAQGNSFDFPIKCFQRAIKNLKRIRVIDLANEKDIDNAEILCNMDPDSIKEVIEERDDLPNYVRNMLN